MRIAWLGKKSPFCGNVSYGLATTAALRDRGHEIHFIHFDTPATQIGRLLKPGPGDEHELAAEDQPDVALPYLVKSQMYTIPSPRANRELRESLERIQPDVVHASLTLSPLDFGLPELCQQLQVPLVATFHPFDASLRNITAGGQQLTYQLYAPSLARYNKVIVFSDLQAEVLNRLGVPEDRLAVIPNGVDPRHWHPGSSELQQRFNGRRVFLYMGRLATEKNVEALLRAWKLVQPEGCVLVVVGDGPLRNTLETTTARRTSFGGATRPINSAAPPCCRPLKCSCCHRRGRAFACPAGSHGERLRLRGHRCGRRWRSVGRRRRHRDQHPRRDHPTAHAAAGAARSAPAHRRTGPPGPPPGDGALHPQLQHRFDRTALPRAQQPLAPSGLGQLGAATGQGGAGITGFGDRPADHQLAGAGSNGLRWPQHPGLITCGTSAGTNPRCHQGKRLRMLGTQRRGLKG